MSDYDNTNRGILGRNDRKTLDTHPDFSGSINVDGKDYWLSGWVKERKDGSGRFFSLTVKPKDGAPAAPPRKSVAEDRDIDSDIPF